MSNMENGGKTSGAWNWTALSKQAVERNTAHAQHRQTEVVQQVRAAAATARGRAKAAASVAANGRVPRAAPITKEAPLAPVPTGDIETFSGLRIADRTVPADDLATEMADRKFIPLRAMDEVPRDVLSDDKVDWVTIGVVARKTLSKAAVNGSSFLVWSLSDLATTELAVFLFDGAYESHWRALEGSLVAVLNAPLMPASEKNKFALKVAKADEIVVLGRAPDFGICKGMNSSDVRCRLAVNTAKSHYCLHHIASGFVAAGKRRQQLNNSFSTFNKSMFSSKSQLKNISAGVYGARPSTAGSAVAANGWRPIITSNSANKRKRTDGSTSSSSGARLGVPTVISSSGSVSQRPLSMIPSAAKKKKAAPDALLGGSFLSGTAEGAAPLRASRGQKIIASMMAKTGNATTVLRPNTGKKVDMMKFMNSGK